MPRPRREDPATDHWATLGLPPGATPSEVKRRFRALARQHHPDRAPHDPDATRRFQAIAEAAAVLSDPQRRAAWEAARGHPAGPVARPTAGNAHAARAYTAAKTGKSTVSQSTADPGGDAPPPRGPPRPPGAETPPAPAAALPRPRPPGWAWALLLGAVAVGWLRADACRADRPPDPPPAPVTRRAPGPAVPSPPAPAATAPAPLCYTAQPLPFACAWTVWRCPADGPCTAVDERWSRGACADAPLPPGATPCP
jgi:hypothetical protein